MTVSMSGAWVDASLLEQLNFSVLSRYLHRCPVFTVNSLTFQLYLDHKTVSYYILILVGFFFNVGYILVLHISGKNFS